MNSYNKLIHTLVLIVDLYLFRSPVGVAEFILVRRYPYVLQSLYLYGGTRRYYRACTCTEVPVGTTQLILVQRYPWVHSEHNDVYYFTLIRYLDSYHIIV